MSAIINFNRHLHNKQSKASQTWMHCKCKILQPESVIFLCSWEDGPILDVIHPLFGASDI